MRLRSDAVWTGACATTLLAGYISGVLVMQWWLGVELRVCSALVC